MLRQWPTAAAAQAVAAALVGLFALPAIVGAGSLQVAAVGVSPATPAVIWLVGALLVAAWLIACGPALARGTSRLLERWVAPESASEGRRSVAQAGAGVAAGSIVAVLEVVVIQAVLRRPIVIVLGALTDPSTVDAAFAAGTLILLIFLLIWLHRATRPLVEAATWQALDAIVATSGSERARALAEAADTRMATALATTQRGADSGLGRTLPREAAAETVAAPEATRPAWPDAPTLAEGAATRVTDDATRVDPDRTRPG